jgi:glycosyltransferase involved in cell wall biosynthesis
MPRHTRPTARSTKGFSRESGDLQLTSRFRPSVLKAFAKVWRWAAPVSVRRHIHNLRRCYAERRVLRAARGVRSGFRSGPLIVSGFFSETKGISEAARMTVAGLKYAGFHPVAHDIRETLEGRGAPEVLEAFDAPGGGWIVHCNPPEAIALFNALPKRLWIDRYRIGYWAYELEAVPESWVRASSLFDEIWAPSTFVAEALKSSGVTCKVRKMPHPVSLTVAERSPFQETPMPRQRSVLVMGDLLSSVVRKNLLGAVDVYCQAFPVSDGSIRLRIKCQSASSDPEFMEAMRSVQAVRPDVEVISNVLSGDATRDLISSSDVLLSLHRSEGFGLALAEALLLGVPPLATGWSGNMEFMSDIDDLLIRWDWIPVKDRTGIYQFPGARWAEPDRTDAVEKLQKLMSSPALRSEVVKRGREAILSLEAAWSPDSFSQFEMSKWIDSQKSGDSSSAGL